jgi:hypothetical protein
MISIEKLMGVLNKDSAKYSKEEVIKIRDLIYLLANLEYKLKKKYQRKDDKEC